MSKFFLVNVVLNSPLPVISGYLHLPTLKWHQWEYGTHAFEVIFCD